MTAPEPEVAAARMTAEPTDPDVDLHVPAQRRQSWRAQGPIVAVVALGGAIGASVRYGAGLLWPTASGAFPWTTLWVNVVGCAVIGAFMVLITDVWAAHRLVRPFFGTGVLGGFTTFSTYALDIQRLVDGGHPRTGLAYLAATLCAALAAVWLAATVTRRLVAGRQR
ncbi:fluoride efflux transporter CrcB [Streptomyces sp. LP11]|uniref:Fluoride-specific ion channel FluC n=1 Tax=Streptomyces pyxinicus TaxID=2970331 RepID=A0ABT2AYF5_9ACTN|nr:fluoride efflux transporter CrcB [Streptomyces sp. LP11]MCS0601190.1 fluoride efflux transporter CrcB [Streptomyces sp. LP11]